MVKISIIVPVYNVAPYLHKCIDSILNQTFSDFECILVNNGSTDNSAMICEEYKKIDARIIVIHQNNSGVSAARNAGLDIVRGEWIGFVDSDDWCEPGMFSFLLEMAEIHNADISTCGCYKVDENNGDKIIKKRFSDKILNRKKSIIKLLSNQYYESSCWNKLYNKRLFHYNENCRFNEKILLGEDFLFNYFMFKKADKIFYSSKIFYNYRIRQNSCMQKYIKKGWTKESESFFEALNIILVHENEKKMRSRILAAIGGFAAISCLFYINDNGLFLNDKYYFLSKNVKDNIWHILRHGNIKRKICSILVFWPLSLFILCKLKKGKLL